MESKSARSVKNNFFLIQKKIREQRKKRRGEEKEKADIPLLENTSKARILCVDEAEDSGILFSLGLRLHLHRDIHVNIILSHCDVLVLCLWLMRINQGRRGCRRRRNSRRVEVASRVHLLAFGRRLHLEDDERP